MVSRLGYADYTEQEGTAEERSPSVGLPRNKNFVYDSTGDMVDGAAVILTFRLCL